MDEKRSRSSKRKSMTTEEGYWDCSVCTYRNSPEAFKCEMCDVRKGTSTRKPRINPQVMQQVAQQVFTPPPLKKEKKEGSTSGKKPEGLKKDEPSTSKDSTPKTGSNKKPRPPRLKNVDRSTARSMEVTVGNVTVVITDYQPKKPSEQKNTNSATSPASSSSSKEKDSPSKGEEGNKPSKPETVVNGESAATKDES